MSFAEKLKDAGADTVGARFTVACTDAIRFYPTSVPDAWDYVGRVFGAEFIRGLMADMQKAVPAKERRSPPVQPMAAPKPYQPRVIPQERLEKRRELQRVVRSKYMNSGGIAWSDCSWHELRALDRDGTEARALLEAGPDNIPNDGRTVGEVLGIAKIDKIIGEIRFQSKN